MTSPADVLLSVYGQATTERIAEGHGLPTDDAHAALEEHFSDKAARSSVVESLTDEQRGLLAFMDDIGRRLRGERLKKRWFLHGYTNFEELVYPLVNKGIVLVGNVRAREPVSLDTALEQGILQQWLQVTPGFEDLAGDAPPPGEIVEGVEDETTVDLSRRTLIVEFNLLNVVRFVESSPIRLNRDGSPHRSDLKSLAGRVVDRYAAAQRGEPVPDPGTASGFDVIIFVLSLAEGLGLVARTGDLLKATDDTTTYFTKPIAERIQLLGRAAEHQQAWSELDARRWHEADEPPTTGEGDGGFGEGGGHGGVLAGPRGSMVAALRRLAPGDWFSIEDVAGTIVSLERQYLAKALPVGVDLEPPVEAFVEAFLTQTLPHLGAAELGTSEGGEKRARLTEVGRAMIGLDDAPEEPSGRGAILVEPNFEITCFLDMASMRLLFDLSRFAELTRTSERVVRYRLQGESVQWGYVRGYTADGITKILSEFSTQPLPPAVKFALQDWERLHRRVTVFLHGDVVAAVDADDPEIIQSGVTFVVEDGDIEIIDASHTFAAAGYEEELERALRAQKPLQIDYTGEITPTLHWIDEDKLRAPRGGTDFRTLSRLDKFCVPEDDEVWRVAPDKIRSSYSNPDEGYEALLKVLRDGLIDGLSAEREIMLKRLLGEPADAEIETMEVLTVSSDDDGDRIDRIPQLDELIDERLGPRAFRVAPGCAQKLTDLLRDLGIAVETRLAE